MIGVQRPDPTVLETERLLLRPAQSSDVEPLFAMRSDPEWAHFGAPNAISRAAVEASVGRAVDYGWAGGPYFVITLGGEVVGDTLLQVEDADEIANLGYAVARAHWGTRIATEAARAVVDHGFLAWDLKKIYARADPRNVASVKVLQAIPMEYEGTLRQHHVRHGERVDRVMYGVLQQEWEQ
jgi:[ribosomal protein S5]-alanine N-acetyltransferase